MLGRTGWWSILLPAAVFAADPPQDLGDSQAWYRAALTEAGRIPDPEQRHLIGQLAAASQKVKADEADRQVAERRAKYAGAPGIAAWQIEEAAYRQYETLGFPRQAEKALREAIRGAKQAGADAAVLSLLESQQCSFALHAADANDLALAWEIVDRIENAEWRKEAAVSVAFGLAESDLPAAERALTKYTGVEAPQRLRELLLSQARNGKPVDLERGIAIVVRDAPTMNSRDLAACYSRLTHASEISLTNLNRELLTRLSAQIERTRRRPIDPAASDLERRQAADCVREATRCQAELRLALGEIEEAVRLVDEANNKFVSDAFRRRAAIGLIRQKKFDEAVKMSPAAVPLVAAERLKANQPGEALALTRSLDDLMEAYPYLREVAARALDARDDKLFEQSLAELTHDDLRVHCLASLAKRTHGLKQGELARHLFARAEKMLLDVKDAALQRSAGRALAFALGAVEQSERAAALTAKYGDRQDEAGWRLGAAERALAAKDLPAFRAAAEQAVKVIQAADFLADAEREPAVAPPQETYFALPAEGTSVPTHASGHGELRRPRVVAREQPTQRFPLAIPVVPVAPAMVPARPVAAAAPAKAGEYPNDQSGLRFHFLMQIARMYVRAGDLPQARRCYTAALADNAKIGGTFWRYELYSYFFASEPPTQAGLEELAELAKVAENPADRAILLALGGAFAKALQKK